MKKTGLLLLNLGTPDSPKAADVARYLKQFLMDKRVVDIPWALRWFFVNVLIVPKRQHASGEAYEKIWTERGSPLLFHLKDLTSEVASLADNFEVEYAMRYGSPSVETALGHFKSRNIDEVIVFPLYPQYAESSTLSSIEDANRAAAAVDFRGRVSFIPPFYEHPAFIEAFAHKLNSAIEREKPDHVLMSFHGVPVRHVRRTDKSGGAYCLRSDNCCAEITDVNRDCYRAQCYATARALAKACHLPDTGYTVSFQSRLGRTEWIPPYTDHKYKELADRGIKTLAVVCPSFVADCLETIEEIGIRGAEEFRALGGTRCAHVPCPNSDPKWAHGVVQIVRDFVTERTAQSS